jgi:hypothetical protein
MDSLDPSDSQRGHSFANYVYLILLMMPYQDKIHIYLKSIGFMSCIRELLSLSNYAEEGTSCAFTGSLRYATLLG